ncbi:MAG TPA: hypothetical protein VGF55_00060 [Gemmataceae bacterium]|jgi:hypothetical protein
MDPVTIAAATGAVSVLASKCAEGFASEAGKSLWEKVKGLFGWGKGKEPDPAGLPTAVAERLHDDAQLLGQVLELLKTQPASAEVPIVGSVFAKKSVVAQTINAGTFNM